VLLTVSYNNTAFPLYGSTVESLSRRQGLTIKLSSDRTKFHQKSVIDFFIHVMTFSRCRRLNVHRKTGYPSFLYPLANVRPLTTMSWSGNWCILGTTKRWKPIFYHVSSLFFILLPLAKDVRCVTSKAQDDTLFYRLPMTSPCRYPGLTTLHRRTFGEGTGIQLTAGTPKSPPPL